MENPEWQEFRSALRRGDVAGARRLLTSSQTLRSRINEPISHFGSRPVHMAVKNPALMDVLLEFGADINLRSDWEKGPFSVLDYAPQEAARYYISRGAKLTAHAAARLGWIDELRALVDADPHLVHEKGGDGQRPLHFAKTQAVVDLLLARGAEIDARCEDHHSTAAQYALAERPEICRLLLWRGATADIFMAARLGDADLAKTLISADSGCLAARINAPGYAAVVPFNIYCWTLGWCLSPHEVALKFDHPTTYEFLLAQSPVKIRLLVACSRGEEAMARQIVAQRPGVMSELSPPDHALLPFSLFYNRPAAFRLMLSLGFDPQARGTDGGTSLHYAAWHGMTDIAALLLRNYRGKIDLEALDTMHQGTPMGWAMHGSIHSFVKGGNHAQVVRDLIAAGAKLPRKIGECSAAVGAVLREHGVGDA